MGIEQEQYECRVWKRCLQTRNGRWDEAERGSGEGKEWDIDIK